MPMLRTPPEEHERLAQLALERGLKKPPRRPEPKECCDTGCGLCVWDYYEIRLKRWRAALAESDGGGESNTGGEIA